MIKQSMPAVSILDKDSIEEFKKAENVVLVGYFDADDTASNETFTAVANSLREKFLLGATNDDALAKAEGVKKPAIILYKQFDDGKSTFTEKFDKEAIEHFAKTASVPLIGEVGPETYADYMAVRHSRCRWNFLDVVDADMNPSRPASRLPTSSRRRPRSALNWPTSFDPWP